MMLDECPWCGADVGPKLGKRNLADHIHKECSEAPRDVDMSYVDASRPLRVDVEAERALAQARGGGQR